MMLMMMMIVKHEVNVAVALSFHVMVIFYIFL